MSGDDKSALQDLQRHATKLNEALSKLAGDRTQVLFGEYALNYLKTKLENPTLRPATLGSFRNQVANHLIPAFGKLPIERVDNAEFLRWVTGMRNRKHGLTNFFNARKYLTEILRSAQIEGVIERLPKFDNPDEQKSVGRALSEREIFGILRHIKSKQWRFFFFVLWKMGCRPQEVLRWEWGMFKWGEPGHTWIDIPARISKTGRSRSIPVNPNVSRRLYMFRAPGKFVFPKPSDSTRPNLAYHNSWQSACKLAGISAVPYDLRRTFITRCAAEGRPLLYVAKALDTSTRMIESVYAKVQIEVMEGIVK